MNPLDWSAMQQVAALVWLAIALSTALEVYLWSLDGSDSQDDREVSR